MAGVGKSELALQYAKSKLDKFKGGVAYFSAEKFLDDLTDFVIEAQLHETTDFQLLKSPKAQARKAWQLWREFCESMSAKALVVIDDVKDYQAEIADFLPQISGEASPFRILLTSRTHWENVAAFELEELELRAASEVFCHCVGKQHQDRLNGQMATVESLCERLGRLPLALVLAGSWLGVARSGHTVEALVTALEANGLLGAVPLDIGEEKTLDTRKRQKQGLEVAFRVSWQQLAEFDLSAQQLARVLSLFEAENLDWELVENVAAAYPVALPPAKAPQRNLWQRFMDWLRGLFGQVRQVEKAPERPTAKIPDLMAARDWLLNTSLLREVTAGKVYRVHALLHEYFGEQWDGQSDQQGWQMAFVAGLSERAEDIPANADWEQVTAWQSLRPYFKQSMAVADGLLQTEENAEVRQRLKSQRLTLQAGEFRLNQAPIFANTFQQAKDAHQRAKAALAQGKSQAANQYLNDALSGYKRAIEQGRQALPKDSLTLAGYLKEIAYLYYKVGRYQDGITAGEEAFAIVQNKITPLQLTFYVNLLGNLHYAQGNVKRAEIFLKKALFLSKEIYGDRHPDVAVSLNNLAGLYKSQGKYEAAQELRLQCLDIERQTFGDKHPQLASSLNNLALLYESQGKYEAAEPLFLDALQMRKELLGDRHPDVATSLNNLALLYESQGKYEAAEPLYIEALQMMKELLGDRHPDVATSMNNLAQLYKYQEKYEAAEPLYIDALQMRKELLGDHHPDVAQSMNNLAGLYRSQGKYEAAEPLYIDALQMCKELLGDRHPSVAASLNNLALLYTSQGKYEAAEPLYIDALQMCKELLGDRHPDVASSMNNLAVLYYYQQRFDEAELLLLQALEIQEAILGSNHPNTIGTKQSLANLRTNR